MKRICALFAIVFLAAIGFRTAVSAPGPNDLDLSVSSSSTLLPEDNFVDPTMYQGYVCAVMTQGGRLNVRSIPSISGRVVAKLVNGTEVRVVGVRNDWSRVARRGRVLGWVLSSYLECGDF